MSFLDITNNELIELGRSKHHEYINADPFPNMYFDNFFNQEHLSKVLNEFPDLRAKPDIQYNNPNEVKLASKGEARFGEHTRAFMHFLNSEPFLNFLSALTGIDDLVPDPYFIGGGHHEILPGGFLKMHADFNKHPKNKLDRRINALIYLNKDWEESYGGHFQLWDKEMKECRKKILPLFNRLAIFSTTDFSYHGHPDPLSCPPDRSRRSLALYYYTNGRPEEEINSGLEEHNTLFKYRAGEDDTTRRKLKLKKIVELITPPIFFRIADKLKK
ncbi:MAG: 2OG-Fe(II) oxygenase [Sphingobacteriales bacterium]|nr:2OG-Fe(II) oxygenase [Sphingobacteriales bacterium]MBI3718035.1 2OG-Fe(II) oxygenase [Sphingobacteriales bacterium]